MTDRTLPLADLRETGMLWLINKVVFHPRGFALAQVYQDGQFAHWALQGDGSEPWRFDDAIDEEQFHRAEAKPTLKGSSRTRHLYAIHVTGGPLHTALDDWNLSGTIAPYYDGWTEEELDKLWCGGWEAFDLAAANPSLGNQAAIGRSTRSICDEIASILNGMSERERYAALAYADGFAERVGR